MTRDHAAARPATLLVAGAAPLAAGRLVPLDGTEVDGPTVLCPFREATGLPCPLCGATRAMALAARGDDRFLDFGAVWVSAAVLAVLLGTAGLAVVAIRRLRDRDGFVRRTELSWGRVAAATAGVVAIAWAWTLTHQDSIVDA